MGADRAILVTTDEEVEPLAVAKILAKIAGEEQPGMIVLGKQAIDDDCNQTGQMLPPCSAGRRAPSPPRSNRRETVKRHPRSRRRARDRAAQASRRGHHRPRLNEPRYASLPNIMKAKSKPLANRTPDELAWTSPAG
jgi:electron transfer flavoprotein beta subunit